MPVRFVEGLRRDQAALTDELRRLSAAAGAVAQLPRPGTATTVLLWGQVTSVVSSDETYGPHLMVQPQAFSGVPPTAADTSGAALRCYPSPNRVVGDYSVDEYVKVLTCRGALIADKAG